MKKLLFLLFILFPMSAAAAPNGFLVNYYEPRDGQTKAERPGERYLMGHIMDGKPVRVGLFFHSKEIDRDVYFYKQLIADGYAQWFAATAKIIRRSGRGKEFADILPLLDRGVQVQFPAQTSAAGRENVDITFHIVPQNSIPKLCRSNMAGGCYSNREGAIPRIYLPDINGRMLKWTARHEIGHSLGLSDQYKQARSHNSHALSSTEETTQSIMNQTPRFTCDDADGVIRLIDSVYSFSRGGELGWRSLCKSWNVTYVHNQPSTKGPYVITPSGKQWRLDRFQDGQKVSETLYSFDTEHNRSPFEEEEPETVLEVDGAGRVVRALGSRGEDIYYSYAYDRKHKLVLKDHKIAWGEIYFPMYVYDVQAGEDIYNGCNKYFGENGSISGIGYLHSEGIKASDYDRAWYESNLFETDKSGLKIELIFTRAGYMFSKRITFSDGSSRDSRNLMVVPTSSRPTGAGKRLGSGDRANALAQEISKQAKKAAEEAAAEQKAKLLEEWYLKH